MINRRLDRAHFGLLLAIFVASLVLLLPEPLWAGEVPAPTGPHGETKTVARPEAESEPAPPKEVNDPKLLLNPELEDLVNALGTLTAAGSSGSKKAGIREQESEISPTSTEPSRAPASIEKVEEPAKESK